MIIYLQFNKEYELEVKSLIENIMEEDLKIRRDIISNITSDLDDIYSNYIKKGGNFWIAVDSLNNNVVGTVAIKTLVNGSAEFKRFYVKKEYRKKKIGSLLYNIAENFAKEENIKELYLVSGDNSKEARKIYIKNNWKIVDKENVNVNIFVRDGVNLYKKVL